MRERRAGGSAPFNRANLQNFYVESCIEYAPCADYSGGFSCCSCPEEPSLKNAISGKRCEPRPLFLVKRTMCPVHGRTQTIEASELKKLCSTIVIDWAIAD
jgi:hypothetical protein